MKGILIKIYSFFNTLFLRLVCGKTCDLSGLFFRVKISKAINNSIRIRQSATLKSVLSIQGNNNLILANNAYISNSIITISGSNNKLIVGDSVKLRDATITIRGEGCVVEIGNRTTFGGIRIINVGVNTTITIGEDCLFADQIEVWSSDTHTIYDEHGDWINHEKPVIIGNGVWVGSRVIILKGVTIGNSSIIGMGSLVTKSVPEGVVCAGNPLKVIKEKVTWDLNYRVSTD